MIYKITNTVNSKAYICYSSNVEGRWKDHKTGYGSKAVYDAIQKYGLDNFTFEVIAEDTVDNEDKYIKEHNTMAPNGYNLVEGGGLPPSKKGWKPSEETLAKRSASLKGIERTDEWCSKLSEAKKGVNNPMYGKKNPCSEQKRLDIIRTKNEEHLETYKKAVAMMNNGYSTVQTWKELGISRTTVIRLKNRTHGFFKLFPELV